MIGVKVIAGALSLLCVVNAIRVPVDVVDNGLGHMVDQFKSKGFFKDGKVDIPVAKYCDLPYYLNRFSFMDSVCVKLTDMAMFTHNFESATFCGHVKCDATYDPSSGLCQCSWGTSDQMKEDNTWPDKSCNKTTKCFAPYAAHWDPSLAACTCAVETFPHHLPLVRFKPHPIKEQFYGPSKTETKISDLDSVRHNVEAQLEQLKVSWDNVMASYNKTMATYQKLMATVDVYQQVRGKREAQKIGDRQHKRTISTVIRQATSGAVSLAPLPTYIPPPNTNVTQELVQESLLLQPQQKATVGSVIPDFARGIISFLVQLDGPIAQTLTLNSTDTLPCESIGVQPQPNLMLVPKVVRNGSQETALPNCLVIAVNMYNPKYITYWVQKDDGSVFSLLSDNNIHAIDQLDTSQSAAIAIRVAPVNSNSKRATQAHVGDIVHKRHQIFSVKCGEPCPFYHMNPVQGSDGHCGCMFIEAERGLNIATRGIEPITPHTATMTAEACAAMACVNNGGKSPLFNPFTATCWCTSPVYVEQNANSYNGGL